jgi:DNA-directed RNA polymerase subunit RPC12/RpoP
MTEIEKQLTEMADNLINTMNLFRDRGLREEFLEGFEKQVSKIQVLLAQIEMAKPKYIPCPKCASSAQVIYEGTMTDDATLLSRKTPVIAKRPVTVIDCPKCGERVKEGTLRIENIE